MEWPKSVLGSSEGQGILIATVSDPITSRCDLGAKLGHALSRLLLALGLGLLFLFTTLCAWRSWLRPIASTMPQVVVVTDPAALARRAKTAASPAAEPGPITRFTTPAGSTILYTANAVNEAGEYDAIIHFHGVYTALEPALRDSQLNCVVLIVEAGLTAQDYSRRFGAAGTLQALLRGLRRQVSREHDGAKVRERRLAISAWSAGYGATNQILRRPEDVALISALLLSDSPHAAFLDLGRRVVSDDQLEPYRLFAESARAGERVFGMTHTQIQTGDFASTTEVAERLRTLLKLPEEILPASLLGLESLRGQIQQGGILMQGFSGGDRHAHAEQQRLLGQTLWRWLARHWSNPVPPAKTNG